MIPTSRYMTDSAIQELRKEIDENGGVEIFAILERPDETELWDRVTVVCRGTEGEVPALMSRITPGCMAVHNHPDGVLRASQADLFVSSLLGEEGAGSMIVDNGVTHCFVIAEPAKAEARVEVKEAPIHDVFREGGSLSEVLEGYEPRTGQVNLAKAVAVALNQGQILTAEAGTGTGKSLAYLVPALLWARENNRRIAIATKTINLQEQLLHKDIPIARRLIDKAPEAALIKGRSNYVCLRKLRDTVDHQLPLFDAQDEGLKREIADLAAWVEDNQTGDKADLPFMPSREAWERVMSESDLCLGNKCPYFQESPFYLSRRRASAARLLIVNQALLFSDLSVRVATDNFRAAAVIPPYEGIILDEAHSVEETATQHFAERLSSIGLIMTLGRFISQSGNRGMLPRLRQFAEKQKLRALADAMDLTLLPAIEAARSNLLAATETLTLELHEALNPKQSSHVEIWLRDELLATPPVQHMMEAVNELHSALHAMISALKAVKEPLEKLDERLLEPLSGLRIEYEAKMSRLRASATMLKRALKPAQDNQVLWLSLTIRRRQYFNFEFRVSPLQIGPWLQKGLFTPFHSVVMTSATLNLKDQFAFFASRVGLNNLEEKETVFSCFPSPFDYARQATCRIPELPCYPDHSQYAAHVVDVILNAANPETGGTLVLFTSYSLLNAVARLLEHDLERRGIELLVQGSEQRSSLLHRLVSTSGVLLGTDSFWEGVDLRGDALTQLIITKLPFPQMTDPIFQARCHAMEKEGISSFQHYSLPLALLKFKQGAGRLIRSRTDHGILWVTDRRILDKSYGRRFLSQIEAYPISRLPWGAEVDSDP